MGKTDWGGNCVLFWWAGSCSEIFNPVFCWWVEPCSLLAIYMGPNNGRCNEDNGEILQKIPCVYYYTQCPQPCSRPLLTHTSPGDSCTLIGKSRSVSCGVTALFSWVLVHTRFCLFPPRVCFPRTHIRPTMLCFFSFQFFAFIIYSRTLSQVKNFLGIQISVSLWISWKYLYLRMVSFVKLNSHCLSFYINFSTFTVILAWPPKDDLSLFMTHP